MLLNASQIDLLKLFTFKATVQYKLPTLILRPATFHLGIKLLLTVTVDRALKIFIIIYLCILLHYASQTYYLSHPALHWSQLNLGKYFVGSQVGQGSFLNPPTSQVPCVLVNCHGMWRDIWELKPWLSGLFPWAHDPFGAEKSSLYRCLFGLK